MTKQPPLKVAVIGAGSTVFTPGLLVDMCQSPAMHGSHVSLMDIDSHAVDIMTRLGQRIVTSWEAELTIEGTTDRRRALYGADFVVVTIAVGGAQAWKQDVDIPARYGFAQTVGDTVGPGGVFRALRHIPVLVSIAHDMEELCPDAWLINYTNPLSALVCAVVRMSHVKCLGLCHGVLNTRAYLASILDCEPQDLELYAAGINHLTWVLELRDAAGRDLYPRLRKRLTCLAEQVAETACSGTTGYSNRQAQEREHALVRLWQPISYRLMQVYGYYPSPGDRHVAEFYPLFLKDRNNEGKLSHGLQRALNLTYQFIQEKYAYWDHLRAQADGTVPLSDDLTRFGREGERVIHVIEALLGQAEVARCDENIMAGSTLEPAINIPNNGHISNLPRGAIVEVPALIGPFGVRGLAVGSLPPAIAATLQYRIQQQEMTVEAALTGDRSLLLQALLADELVDSYDRACLMMEEMLAAQRAYLPQFTS